LPSKRAGVGGKHSATAVVRSVAGVHEESRSSQNQINVLGYICGGKEKEKGGLSRVGGGERRGGGFCFTTQREGEVWGYIIEGKGGVR